MEWILIGVGVFSLIGVVIFNIGMNTRKAQSMVRLIGYGGAKIFYGILGAAMIVLGILSLVGAIQLQ